MVSFEAKLLVYVVPPKRTVKRGAQTPAERQAKKK
jgi:hypothetical protein